MKKELIRKIEAEKIIMIVRGTYGEDLYKLVSAVHEGGINFVEVTFDQKNDDPIIKTAEAITMIKERFNGEVHVGAGTVLNVQQVKAAYAAGAEYIISPNTNEKVIKASVEHGLISIPGALTPSEIADAHDWGADFIKLFPGGTMGIKYAKDIMAPLGHVKYLATAGINEEVFEEYLKIGFSGAGISGRLTEKSLINEGNFSEFTTRAKAFTEIAKKY